MSDQRDLVVGTTPDYIAHIHELYTGRALFLTDISLRAESKEAIPDENSEIVCRFLDKERIFSLLLDHLKRTDQKLSGVACYDCEWLSLAAEIAAYFNLPYPSLESVRLSRDKFRTKKRWVEYGVRCPKVELVQTGYQAMSLADRFGGPVVLKPLNGSGSELTFYCQDKYDLTIAYQTIKDGLVQRNDLQLYKLDSVETSEEGIDYPILAEEFILGREYSADFIIENDNIQLIRVAKKLHDNALVFGTTMAYVVPAKLPGWINHDALAEKFRKAADALGINHAICMVDFIIGKDEVIFLELTPRIGGDCLPHLIRRSCGLDTIGLALDFAEGKKYDIPPRHRWKEHVGMRLFSSDSGKLININCDELSRDNRVREIFIKREPGEEIVVPPDDYDSWLLGHVLFEPESGVPLRTQCNDLRKKIFIDVEQYYDQKLSRPLGENYRDSQPAGPAA